MLDLDDARELLAAADRDLSALRGMEDTTVFADEIAGFHAQQAVQRLENLRTRVYRRLAEAEPL